MNDGESVTADDQPAPEIGERGDADDSGGVVDAAASPAERGTLDRRTDGYTLIVGSSVDRRAADQQIARFSELDMPFGVLGYTEDDVTRYRLAVGRFNSAAEADSVRQSMSNVLPAGTWVWHIR
jgi:hypothetical protein